MSYAKTISTTYKSQNPFVFSLLENEKAICIFWFLIFCTAIAQNYVAYLFSRTAFYTSESLLFNSTWLLFIPFSFFLIKIIPKLVSREFSRTSFIVTASLLALILGTAHLLVFSLFVSLVTGYEPSHSFSFTWLIIEVFTEDFYLLFFIYLVLTFFYSFSEIHRQRNTLPNNYK